MAQRKTVKKKISKKVFDLVWSFENFEEHLTFYTKRMFGGMAAYVHGKMMVMIAEDEGKNEYRGKVYELDIWNGILYPTDFAFHDSLQSEFPNLIQHPVLKKWLYLPVTASDFESLAHELALCIRKNDKRFGIYPQNSAPKKKTTTTKKSAVTKKNKAKVKKKRS